MPAEIAAAQAPAKGTEATDGLRFIRASCSEVGANPGFYSANQPFRHVRQVAAPADAVCRMNRSQGHWLFLCTFYENSPTFAPLPVASVGQRPVVAGRARHTVTASNGRALSAILLALAVDPQRERISIGDLLSALGDRATGALMFIFAFPNVLPTPPGTSTILGAPLVFLAAQLMLGRPPWLPAFVANRAMTRADFFTMVKRIAPWLQRAESLLRPRLVRLALPPMEHLVGLLSLVLAVLLVLPIPLGNVLPALAISLMALGVLEHDGVWVMAGLAVAVAAVSVVAGVVFAMARAALFFFSQVW